MLSKKACENALKKYIPENDFKFVSYEIEPFSPNREGFMCDHYYVHVSYKNSSGSVEKVRFFLKSVNASATEYQKKMINDMYCFEKEMYLYKELVPELEKSGCDVSFAPKCYNFESDSIVMEDLRSAGFVSIDKTKVFDTEHIKTGLKTLAKLHAAGILYVIDRSTATEHAFDFNVSEPEVFKERYFVKDENNFWYWFHRKSMAAVEAIIGLLPNLEIPKDKVLDKLKEKFENAFSAMKPTSNFLKTLVHGDVWCNNFLFKYEGDKITACKLIDYQNYRYNLPAHDVLLFLYYTTTREFRKHRLLELCKFYYDTLKEEVEEKGTLLENLMRFEDFMESCKRVCFPAKFQSIYDHFMIYVPDDALNDIFKRDDGFEYFFENRLKISVDLYKTNEAYKSVVDDDLYHLIDMLQDTSVL